MQSSKIILLGLFIFLLDQTTKLVAVRFSANTYSPIITGLLRFNLVRNEGAAFSILSNFPLLLSIISLFASLTLFLWISSKSFFFYYKGLGLAFLLGGTLGNGFDRWRLGYVVDFIQFIPVNFPIFNFADISINLAILFILIDSIRKRKV